MKVVIERKITYHRRKTGKIDPWIHLGDLERLESLGIKTRARVYCMRLVDGKIVLVPAENQEDPRANRCYRAILYSVMARGRVVLRIRLSYIFIKQVGFPKLVAISFEGDNIIIRPLAAEQQMNQYQT